MSKKFIASSKVQDMHVRMQECVRLCNGAYTADAIRAACDRGEIVYERDTNEKRLVSVQSFMQWCEKRYQQTIASDRERARRDAKERNRAAE